MCVKNSIRNLVTDLVGVSFGNGFAGKHHTHDKINLFYSIAENEKTAAGGLR
jgi:hypothetical protein